MPPTSPTPATQTIQDNANQEQTRQASAIETSVGANSTQPYAALDLGSNSFHLIVAAERPGRLQVIDRHKEVVGLARGLEQTGVISRRAIAVAYRSLARIGQRIRDLPRHHVRVVGTSTLRIADNSKQFIQAAERMLSHPVEVISGREEARLIYLGAAHSVEEDADHRLVFDIGGGSTEVIFGRHFHPRVMESLRIGCISMSDRWFEDGKITSKRMERAVNSALQEIEVVEQLFRSFGCNIATGTSGTILSTQTALGDESAFSITPSSLALLERKLVKLGHIDKLSSLVGPDRAPVFPGGLAILIALCKALEIEAVQTSAGALREGLLHDLLGRAHNEDIRETSVQDLIERFNIDQAHAQRVSSIALSLLDQVKVAWNLDGDENRTLLRWSALLHEIGMDISHSSYHKHGGYLLQNLDLAGFSLRDQFMLASMVRTHRRSYVTDGISDDSPIIKLTILLRLAVVLKRNRMDEPMPKCRLSVTDSGVELTLDSVWLKKHRLTVLDLEQEIAYLRSAPFQLTVNSEKAVTQSASSTNSDS